MVRPVGKLDAAAHGAHAASRSRAPLPLAIDGVTKRYAGGGGVNDITLSVAQGEVFAFLGPNGAGKTTTIRLVLDLIRPDSGTIAVFGLDPRRDGVAVRRRVGYMPGDLALYDRLTARELLTHFAHLRGGPPWNTIADLTEEFDLPLDQPVRQLSKGNRQKVGLVQAFMGRPDLLILDEPTSGLDPLVQQQVHAKIRTTVEDGRSIFLSSHVLSEVGHVADRVAMIRDGQIAAVERMSDLRSRTVHVVTAQFADRVGSDAVARVPGIRNMEWADHKVELEISGDLNPLVRALAGTVLVDLTVTEPDLEELFLEFYRNDPDTTALEERGLADVADVDTSR